MLILIGTSPARQLPTIRSRCQLIRFQPLAEPIVARLLLAQGHVTDAAEAARLASHGEGSPQRALELADTELWSFRETLLSQLAGPTLEGLRLAQAISEFVNAAGKEASSRRARLRQIARFATEFYREWLLAHHGGPTTQDAMLAKSVKNACDTSVLNDLSATACAERCLEVLEQIDRNANQATLIECWTDDLDRLHGGSFR